MRQIPKVGELPAGDYFIGDPCYVLGDVDAEWMAFLNAFYATAPSPDEADVAVFEFKGRKCFVSSTNTGDGCYEDQRHRDYPVDAGMIGAIPVALVEGAPRNIRFVHRVTFNKPFRVGSDEGRWLDKGRRIAIGDITIKT